MLLCVATSVSAEAKQAERGAQHARFFDDDSFSSAKPPSDVVLTSLLETPQVKDSLDEIEDQGRESLRSYFKAALADVSAAGDEVYVVNSIKLPLSSGDSDWFWIVREHDQQAKVILFVIGHTLTFTRHKTNGYRDLLETTGTPNQPEEDLYRYDGAVYRLIRTHLRVVKP